MTDILLSKMDEVLKAASDAQAVASKAVQDSATKEEFNKFAADSAKSLDELNIIKAKQDEAEKVMKELEAKMCRPVAGVEKEGNYKFAMDQYLRKGCAVENEILENIAKDLTSKSMFGLTEDEKAYHIKSLIAGSNPNGGYFIQPQRVSQMVERIFETSPVRQVANVISTSTDSVEMIIDDNEFTSGGWVGEIETRSVTANGQIGLLTIPVHEQYAQPQATQKMIDDAGFDMESWITAKVVDIMSRTENTSFVTGDGSKKAKGFLSYDAWAVNGTYERNKIEQINSGTAGTVTSDGLISLQNSLKEAYQSRAVFMMERATWADVIKLKDGQGQYLMNFANMMPQGAGMTLLGKRVIFADDMPSVASDALAIIYGDFGVGYTIVDRFGFRVIRDEFTAKPYIKYYTTKRVGGAVTNFESLKIQKLAA